MRDDIMYIYTLYDHPSDYPEQVVVRRHVIQRGVTNPEEELFYQADTWQEAKEEMQRLGLVSLGREVSDDPAILESYI